MAVSAQRSKKRYHANAWDRVKAPRPGHSENHDFVEVGAWRIRKLRRRPHLEFYPWGTPDSIPNGHPKGGYVNRDPMALARFYQSLIETGIVESRAGLARYLGVSRARVTQVLRRLKGTASGGAERADQ